MSTELHPQSRFYDPLSLEHQPQSPPTNISESERDLSLLGGAALALYGLGRGGASGLLLTLAGGALVYRGWTGWCRLYEALGINTAVDRSERGGVRAQHGTKITKSILINRNRHELYSFWRKLENLPSVMRHLESVVQLDERRSRWTASTPVGKSIEWEAEIITDRPGELIAWSSLPDSEVDTAGSVHFLPANNDTATELRVTLKYDPPGGRITEGIAHLFCSGLEDTLEDDLCAFKESIEASSGTAAAAPSFVSQPNEPSH